jgi:hypothetical protein
MYSDRLFSSGDYVSRASRQARDSDMCPTCALTETQDEWGIHGDTRPLPYGGRGHFAAVGRYLVFEARIRDQWIAPTFDRHFGHMTWFDSAICIPVGRLNHVLSWWERSIDRESARRHGNSLNDVMFFVGAIH